VPSPAVSLLPASPLKPEVRLQTWPSCVVPFGHTSVTQPSTPNPNRQTRTIQNNATLLLKGLAPRSCRMPLRNSIARACHPFILQAASSAELTRDVNGMSNCARSHAMVWRQLGCATGRPAHPASRAHAATPNSTRARVATNGYRIRPQLKPSRRSRTGDRPVRDLISAAKPGQDQRSPRRAGSTSARLYT
jgi:hypothetical protein